jgi:hypothetical protein
MTQRPIVGLLPALHEDALLAQGYAASKLTTDEALLLRAIRETDGGLTGGEAAQLLGANRLYAGRVAKMLVRLRVVQRRGRRYLLRKEGQ